MAKKYDNEFKVMIIELLNSGIKTKKVSNDYSLSLDMVGR
jgi:transposase